MPSTFTFDACRHGGMTELEETELTEGQGRALPAHRTMQAYAGYALVDLATLEFQRVASAMARDHRLIAEISALDLLILPDLGWRA